MNQEQVVEAVKQSLQRGRNQVSAANGREGFVGAHIYQPPRARHQHENPRVSLSNVIDRNRQNNSNRVPNNSINRYELPR